MGSNYKRAEDDHEDDPSDEETDEEEIEEDEDLEENNQDTVEYELDSFLSDVVAGRVNWDLGDQVWAHYPKLSMKSEYDGKNILHVLIEAYKARKNGGTAKTAIKVAIEKTTARYPRLVQMRNIVGPDEGEAGETPLMTALMSGKKAVITAIIQNCNVQSEAAEGKRASRKVDPLSQALALRCTVGGRTENPLHWSMRNPSKDSNMRKLVERAPREAIVSQDSDGFTPLHYAVDYEHSMIKNQLKMIRTLLRRGESEPPGGEGKRVLDLLTKKGKFSVYQYHVHTRELSKEQSTTGKEQTQREEATPRVQTGRRENHSNMLQRRETRLFEDEFVTVPAVNGNVASTADQDRKTHNMYADEIGMEIKLQYLRSSRTHNEVMSFLYGANPREIQAYMDYESFPNEITASDFIESLKAVEYDQVLQYIHLPAVKVKSPSKALMEYDMRQGRCDLLFFFRWLRKEKGVRRIIKVIVQDDDDHPHTNGAIVEALKDFQIEYLDWKKTDLDPEAILKVGSALTEVSLHWGGNNAVLRAWSEPYGLCQLPKLTKVHLWAHQMRNNESVDATIANIANFKKRLQGIYEPPTMTNGYTNGDGVATPAAAAAHSRVIAVDDHLNFLSMSQNNFVAGPSVFTGLPGDHTSSSHRWLRATDAFAEQIQNVWDRIVQERDSRAPEIVVALIDDGVNTLQDNLIGHVLPGRSYEYDSETGRISSWLESAAGHGTLMASLICRVCPMVRIYPIRLKANANGEIDTRCAIMAIEAAVQRNVDIISMSWTVSRPEGELLAAFDRALQHAIERRILLFCSSKDPGQHSDRYYPRDYSPQSLITVGAADNSGTADKWAGPLDRLDFLFPGVKVMQSYEPLQRGVAGIKESNGSSVATALGAGLAALILYCAHIGQMYGTGNITAGDVQRLRDRDTMVQAIRAFNNGPNGNTNNKFVEVWLKLDRRAKDLETGTPQKHRTMIADFARDLITK